jgi:iron complex outermembrane receptor protein
MKKFYLLCIFIILLANNSVADSESPIDTTRLYELNEVQVTHFYRSTTKTSDVIKRDFLIKSNRGQEPSFILNSQPSVFSYSDTGNEYGYSYFRMRGMDQTRINMTLDGMPLNEGEDMGVYFSNYPDFLGSIHTIKMEPGASISNNGVAGYAGSIDFESINLRKDTSTNLFVGLVVTTQAK